MNAGILPRNSYDSHVIGWNLLQSSLITHCPDCGHLWYLLQSSLITHCPDWGYLHYSSVSSGEFHDSGDTGCHIRVLYKIILFATENVYFPTLLQHKEGQGCRNVLWGPWYHGAKSLWSNGVLIMSWEKSMKFGETPIQCLFIQQECHTQPFISEIGATLREAGV